MYITLGQCCRNSCAYQIRPSSSFFKLFVTFNSVFYLTCFNPYHPLHPIHKVDLKAKRHSAYHIQTFTWPTSSYCVPVCSSCLLVSVQCLCVHSVVNLKKCRGQRELTHVWQEAALGTDRTALLNFNWLPVQDHTHVHTHSYTQTQGYKEKSVQATYSIFVL